jgi:hypothetical protein
MHHVENVPPTLVSFLDKDFRKAIFRPKNLYLNHVDSSDTIGTANSLGANISLTGVRFYDTGCGKNT